MRSIWHGQNMVRFCDTWHVSSGSMSSLFHGVHFSLNGALLNFRRSSGRNIRALRSVGSLINYFAVCDFSAGGRRPFRHGVRGIVIPAVTDRFFRAPTSPSSVSRGQISYRAGLLVSKVLAVTSSLPTLFGVLAMVGCEPGVSFNSLSKFSKSFRFLLTFVAFSDL